MYRVWGLVAAAFVATIAILVGTESRADLFRRDDDTLLFFAGTDLWRHGSFSFAGGLWSPNGIDREGFTFKLLIGAGSYQYASDALGEVTGLQATGFAMAGYRFLRDKLFVTVFAGVDIQHHAFIPDDAANNLWGTHVGIRGAIEVWYEPTPLTMWAADASATSVGPSYAGRVAFGVRAFDAFYIGPEVGGFVNGDNYRQVRAGLHVTGLRSGTIEWSLGAGWLTDTSDREGFYGRIGLLTRR